MPSHAAPARDSSPLPPFDLEALERVLASRPDLDPATDAALAALRRPWRDPAGRSALHLAAQLALPSICAELADPASSAARDGFDRTPLMALCAQSRNRAPSVEAASSCLPALAAHSDIDAASSDGLTALLLALRSGNARLAAELLELGAAPGARSSSGWGAFALALASARPQCMELAAAISRPEDLLPPFDKPMRQVREDLARCPELLSLAESLELAIEHRGSTAPSRARLGAL